MTKKSKVVSGGKSKAKRSKVARNQFVLAVNFIFTILIIAVLAVGAGVYLLEGSGPLREPRTVLIRPGMGMNEIATTLQNEGIVSVSEVFINGVWVYRKAGLLKDGLLKAGEYEIPAHASMRKVMDILVEGRSIEHPFTVPEGLTVAQVFARLADNSLLEGDLPATLPTEGGLMADTIKFVRGTPKAEIVKRLQTGQTRLVQEIWANRDPDIPLKTIDELVTLASIVEKETGIASERPQIAAVFYNRLKKNMRLQSDPTVIYGVFGGMGRPIDCSAARWDDIAAQWGAFVVKSSDETCRLKWGELLRNENPFNTYRNNGLPPAPIAIPGRDSLKAVANPLHTEDLYFVADGAGGHVFAKTLDGHNTNVRKWRQLKQQQNTPDNPELNDQTPDSGQEE